MPRRASNPSRPWIIARRSGFTLVELLVVMTIIIIALGVVAPALSGILASQNFASAVNSVTSTLGNARALAIADREPAGVAMLYDMERDRSSLQVISLEASAASLTNLPSAPSNCLVSQEGQAFRPATNSVPVELPARTGVFGLSFQHVRGKRQGCAPEINLKLDTDTFPWYAGEVIDGDSSNPRDHIIPWIFPRNDPRNFTEVENPTDRFGADPWVALTGGDSNVSRDDARRAVRHSNSFAVFFSPDGTAVQRPSVGNREYRDAYLELPDEPYFIDTDSPNQERVVYDDGQRFDPENFGDPEVSEDERRPNREVLLRGAEMLSVVDLAALSRGVGINRAWLARTDSNKIANEVNGPPYLESAGLVDDEVVRDVGRWIDRNAEIITFNRYTGNVLRRSAQ